MERAARSPEPIIRMVAQTRQHAQLLADLHARALAAARASRSALLEPDADRQRFHPTSGEGCVIVPGEAWIELPESVTLAYEILASGHARQVSPLATVLPDLAFRLGSPAAILAPVAAQGRALGLLALAVPAVVPALEWADGVAACADGFALAIARARLEHERDTLRQRLARTEGVAHLVAGIGHELENPLQGVVGHTELLQRGAPVPAHVRTALRQIHRDASRAARIARNLALLAGTGRIDTRAISINAVLTRVLRLRAASWRALSITHRAELAPGLPRVHGDAVLLQQALLNLVVNAEHAMSAGGGGRIEVQSSRAHDRVVVEIRDSGPGLAPDVEARLFEPFFTTRAGGRGIGLALTRLIVRAHGGDVWAANRAAGGACFTLSLPVTPVVK